MKKEIDCLLIGHNNMDFAEYEKNLRKMGTDTGAYRDLSLNFINYNNKPCDAPGFFNTFYSENGNKNTVKKPLNIYRMTSPAIAYLGSYLHRRGFTFDYMNCFQEEKDNLAKTLSQADILTIAITTTLYVSIFPLLEIMDFIKKYNHTAKVIIGGPFVVSHSCSHNEKVLEYLFRSLGADFYIKSTQGETALTKILFSLKNNLHFHQINNIYYKTDKGYIATICTQENNKLCENPVNWNLFSGRVGEMAAVRTSISCPFSCSYCSYHILAGKFQSMNVQLVKQELNQIHKIGKVKSVNFIDDTFNVPTQRFKDILRMMIKNRYKFNWHGFIRCQYLDKETVALMKESGCEGAFLGLESGSDRILKNMNKSAAVEQYKAGIALLKDSEITIVGSFILGFPGETYETVEDTYSFIKESKIDFYRVHLWYCSTVSPIWQERTKYNIKGESFEWSHATIDSKTAADLIEKKFLSLEEPLWLPQYNFDYSGYYHLIRQGIEPNLIKKFIRNFNNRLREKLNHQEVK